MKAFIVAVVVVFTLVFGVVGIGAVSYINYANKGNVYEQSVDASYKNNQNILGQYSMKVIEAAKVNDKYASALTDLISKALDSRYGEEGSKAMFQMISEQNPTLDPSVYIKLQQIIESGRNEFKVAQTTLLDQCRGYKTDLGYLWGGFWYRLAGYPKEGLEKKCTPVQSLYSKDAFETGIEKGVKF